MTNNQMLQAIFDTVSGIRKDLKDLDEKFTKRIDELDKNLSKRIDRLGREISVLDEDAPTGEDFKKLEKRVKKLEVKVL